MTRAFAAPAAAPQAGPIAAGHPIQVERVTKRFKQGETTIEAFGRRSR